MAREKVGNRLNVIVGTKAQIEGDTSIPENSIIVVTDEELKADEIAYSSEKNVKEAIEGLEANIIESIKVNGTAQTITSNAVNITVPTTAADVSALASTHAASGVTSGKITNWDSAYTDTNNATNKNTASTIVKRDASGNFSAGTITANLTGTASGNLTSSSALNPAKVSQTASYRFVTDSEKTAWSGKQDALGYTAENIANKRTSIRTSGANDTSYVSELGVKKYVDGLIGSVYRPSGDWNASTNSPTLANNTPANAGKVYRVSVAGKQFNFDFAVGDKLAFNESGVISKWDNVDDVVSVNGQIGKVELTTDDIDQGSNLFVSQSEKDTWDGKFDTPAGTTSQYVRGNGSLATFPTIPTVGNGTLTLNTSGSGISGSTSFTANQGGNTTFTVTSNATSTATPNTISLRDSGGNITTKDEVKADAFSMKYDSTSKSIKFIFV